MRGLAAQRLGKGQDFLCLICILLARMAGNVKRADRNRLQQQIQQASPQGSSSSFKVSIQGL